MIIILLYGPLVGSPGIYCKTTVPLKESQNLKKKKLISTSIVIIIIIVIIIVNIIAIIAIVIIATTMDYGKEDNSNLRVDNWQNNNGEQVLAAQNLVMKIMIFLRRMIFILSIMIIMIIIPTFIIMDQGSYGLS